MSLKSKTPDIAYALKGNILHPGTQAQADAAERRAEDAVEEYLGVGTSVLLNTFVIKVQP